MKNKYNVEELKKDIELVKAETDFKKLEDLGKKLSDKYKAGLKELQEKSGIKSYKYPFKMYFGHEYRDVTHIFEEGKEYTTGEITHALIEHGYKEFKFAAQIEYEFFVDENCLFPKMKAGNRG